MRVRNKTEQGVFVSEYGVVPGGDEATVRESDQVKQLIKDGVLTEVKQASATNKQKESDGA
jgi:hypothetical protein